jgi:uncharacterized glyoxalase superfamily protein PhnB
MSHTTAPAKLRSATPVFLVDDIEKTMRWYKGTLDFEADPFPEGPPHAFCILRKDEVTIFLQQLAGYQKPDLYHQRKGGVWSVYLHTQGIEELYDALRNNPDVTVIQPLHRQPYHQTEFEIRDPNGYALVFAEPW